LINSNPKSSWIAGKNKRFEGLSKLEARRIVSQRRERGNYKIVTNKDVPNELDIPDSFDSRIQWPGCIHGVLDQGDCGSCWSFGASESLSDRYCIHSNKKINVALSPQRLISCDYWMDFSCFGGVLQTAWWYMELKGLVSLDCWPYESGNGDVPGCRKECTNKSLPWIEYKVKRNSTETFFGEKAMKAAIMKNGPIEASFAVFDDFFFLINKEFINI